MQNLMQKIEIPALMEPLMPPEGTRDLEDLAIDLISCTAKLAGKLSYEAVETISELVRSMNCYYSNLIEGHNTHPVDIERALNGDYLADTQKRNLQIEAFAHIEVQRLIDNPKVGFADIESRDNILWLHKEFYSRLPRDLCTNHDPKSGKTVEVIPGEFRTSEVTIGAHLPPVASELPKFFDLFEKRYQPEKLSKLNRVIAVAASHHRLLWIHPFFDGNGRVARLHSHMFFRVLGIGSGLWSVSRGLARNVSEYKARLADADSWREDDTDGRGSLSQRGLVEFCKFFLKACIDQVQFMESLLEPISLVERVRKYCDEQNQKKALPAGSFEVIRELILSGSIPRSKIKLVTGYQERQSRSIVAALIANKIIKSESTKADLKLSIPHHVVDSWFPRLYPADLG